jgi:hypothetical protein
MYQNTNLQNYIEQSSSVNLQSIILAEWNMNFSDNISEMGNYRYRPAELSPTEANFGVIKATWSPETAASATKYYYGATDSNINLTVGIFQDTQDPIIDATIDETDKMLYSLTDTVSRFRPRSGINKIRYFGDNYLNYANSNMHEQPRFYLASKDDKFKYWNSYRIDNSETLGGTQRGIATVDVGSGTGDYFIDDTAPFVVYTDPVPANRLVVKMQTGVGDVDNGPYKKSNNTSYNDPFYEDPANTGNLVNQKTPARWKIQYLNTSGTWTTAKTFSINEVRSNGKRVIGSDGYVELAYGITNSPTTFRLLGEYASQYALPISGATGDAYLVPDQTNTTSGKIYVWNGTNWTTNSFVPTYGWYLNEEGLTTKSSLVTSLTSPDFYGTASTIYTPTYREFQFIKGIRIVVDSMSQYGSSFDLIEMSPRLVADMSEKTKSFSIDKVASDIGNTGVPVGQLLAATGNISIFDYDQSFNEYNDLAVSSGIVTGSLISNISSRNLQFKFYEHIIDDRQYPTLSDYYIPIKTMYVDGFPEIGTSDRMASIKLRDMMFYFESVTAPSILLKNASLSFAIATMLDNIGFSNYKFYRNANESEDIIPYFYVAPDKTVAEILNDLAQSTQTAMFFDEDNNFVTMSRNYIMPTVDERATSITLYGTKDYVADGIYSNKPVNSVLSNIISLDAEDSIIYNGGKVVYSNKYIQKSYSSVQEAGMLNKGQSYKNKPVLLWEVAGTESLRPVNDEVTNQSAYSLSALVLNSNLSSTLPNVVSGVIVDNVMDVGQSIYWLTRYKGYLYANAEIIKYDAVEHTISGIGDVWIESVSDYQKYFAKLPFNGKIFPTGRIRIYAEPNFDGSGNVVDGEVAKHGRGQFGTTVTTHTVLEDSNDWLSLTDNHRAFSMQSKWIYRNDHQYSDSYYTLQNATATINTNTVTVTDTTGIKAGMRVYAKATKTVGTQTPTYSSGVVTLTVSSHGFKPGNQIKVESVVPSTYNAIYTIKSVTTNTFTFDVSYSNPGAITTAGKVSKLFDNRGNSAIQSGTEVKEVVSSTQIKLTKNVTAALSGVDLKVTDNIVEPLDYMSYHATDDSIGFVVEKPYVSGKTIDFFDSSSYAESTSSKQVDQTKPNGAIKSSALVVQGPADFSTITDATDAVSYVYKDVTSECPSAYSFGTRMRIVGKPLSSKESTAEAKQMPVGGEILATFDKGYTISGTGGGIAINISDPTSTTNPVIDKNTGYYFEITALTNDSIVDNSGKNDTATTMPNVFFYKVLKGANTKNAIPVMLWFGNAPILVDDGMFVGMSKAANTKNPTVYDLMVETEELAQTTTGTYSRKFYLYINGKLVGTAQDDDAIPVTENNRGIALFVRGKGLCMFENVFVIGDRSAKPNAPTTKKIMLDDDKLDNENYRKYMVNPSVLQTYLKEVGPSHQPKYTLYYEEFGTIMRECAYFNVRYDKAYPALYSKISPTFNDSQGYVVSNFRSNPYSAEFLIFNATDFALNLDESTGNYLRIQGVTFTQQSSHDLTVEEYFQKNSDLNNYSNYTDLNNKYIAIQNSRNTYGRKDFTISGTYIQNYDTANKIMQWMVDKNMHKKKSVGVSIFANPMIQLGDIVTIDYNIDNVLQNSTARFVVYHISYERSSNGPSMKLYLSEVV